MRRIALIALVCIAAVAPASQAQDPPLPDPDRFLEQVRKHLETDDERQTGYMYVEKRREQKLDSAGRTTGESLKVFESYPGLPGEGRWRRLIAEDGRPVPPADLEKVDGERRKRAEEYTQRLAKDPAKERARETQERDRVKRERTESIDDVFRVFDVRMIGRETVEGHAMIVFSLTPRADAKPRTRDGNIMRNFSGRAWVSESDYELARLDLEAIDNVSFGFGLLARVHKGSQASFRRRKVNDEVWLPAMATYTGSARVALVKVMRRGGVMEFSDYKKFTVDTSTTPARPKVP
jgi:hypothetical protein